LEDPVLVAAQGQNAGGVKNLRRVGADFFVCFRMREESGAVRVGSNLRVGWKVRRGGLVFFARADSGPVGKTSRCIRKDKHEEGVLNQIGTTGWFDKTLQARPTT
jgi:hypothetical protein